MKPLSLVSLSWGNDALEPVISIKVVELHHDKHQAAYVTGANNALEKLEKYRKGEVELSLREVMRDLSFNYNGVKLHELYWSNLRAAREDNRPGKEVESKIAGAFGSFEIFKKEFSSASVTVEGSGWGVLWKNQEGELSIGQIEKHNLMALNGWEPILVCDVWEHAYYLDYQNDRAAYVENWWKVVSWEEVRF